jgi:hypothetical protein
MLEWLSTAAAAFSLLVAAELHAVEHDSRCWRTVASTTNISGSVISEATGSTASELIVCTSADSTSTGASVSEESSRTGATSISAASTAIGASETSSFPLTS